MIKVIDSLPIGPKKTLLVVKIRNEKFLIASGAEHTTFLSKLADDENKVNSKNSKQTTQNINKNLDLIPSKQDMKILKIWKSTNLKKNLNHALMILKD